MNDIQPTGKNGLIYIFISVLGKITALFIQMETLQVVATVVSIVVGFLGCMHYFILLYDRLFKKQPLK